MRDALYPNLIAPRMYLPVLWWQYGRRRLRTFRHNDVGFGGGVGRVELGLWIGRKEI